ncbi:MAG: preprotein translocase subunit YajC [Candidatus Fimadaptatus sp.]
MLSNNNVIYFDPLNADQPISQPQDGAATQGGDTGTATGTPVSDPQMAEPNMLGSILSLIVPLLLMGVVFYFFLIRPQRKKDKAVKNMLDALKNGDRVCTIGGIYGTIDRLKDDTVTILVGPEKTKLIMAKWAIRSVENAQVENDAEPEV